MAACLAVNGVIGSYRNCCQELACCCRDVCIWGWYALSCDDLCPVLICSCCSMSLGGRWVDQSPGRLDWLSFLEAKRSELLRFSGRPP